VTESWPQRLRTVAVVLAGGTGSRVGLDRPKQLLKVAGSTVIEHTVAALHDCPEIDEIVIIMAADYVAEAEDLFLDRPQFRKVSRVLAGGADRNESTRSALAALGPGECNVLFHDAVRPLLPVGVVQACVEALQEYEAVDVAIASADTIVRVDDHGCIVEIPDRSYLRRGQTPQGFRLSTIRRAYELASADPHFSATDDCGVVLRYQPDVPIYVVAGDELNMKVTYPIDLFLVDKLFQLGSHLTEPHTPAELAAALRGRTVVVFGGSYGIGADVARLAEAAGSRVFTFSRSTTDTYVERPETVVRALEQAYAEAGRIDAVVLSAAQLATGLLTDMSDDEAVQQLGVNLLGPVSVARASEKYLRETRGHLVLFTSSSYTRGRAEYALYSATKAAVVNLAQALADEWSDAGIRVNVVNPERTRTPMRMQAFGEEPEHTLLKSETVAATVVDLLASDITGQVVDIRRGLEAVEESEADAVAEALTEAVEDAGVPPSVDVL
jgi:2-C-methyl-D-erythritol 4-phosphate cytidylyltransferase